jgi:transcriptional regulator with PAS, ATPase and Fis domain
VRWIFPATDGLTTGLAEGRVLLGRGDDCDELLTGARTSRHHAEIVREGPLQIVRDLGSLNGVAVNGRRVSRAPPGEPAFQKLAESLYGGPTLAAVLGPVRHTARSNLTTVLVGETGTGKECVARAIHTWSGRTGELVAVNCAAITESLAEAELFGYRKGAFSGAVQSSEGHFLAARGGTLLLDEVVELGPAVQAKLLRAVERHEVVPLGESKPIPVDVRIVVAAQESLEKAVKEGRLRGDLCARLDELNVRLPPLRERIDDVPYLFDRTLREQTANRPPAVGARLIEQLCLYDWPYNVRQLVNVVKRLAQLHGHEPELHRSHLPEWLLTKSDEADGDAGGAASEPDRATLIDEKLALLLSALRKHKGVVSRAAREVGIPRQSVYRLLDGRPDLTLGSFRSIDSQAEPGEPGLDGGGSRR